jgi:pimeloyl-ACP methyl ester carboxylesterase
MGADEAAWFAVTPVREVAARRGIAVACPLGRGNVFYRGAGERDVHDVVDWLVGLGVANSRRVFLIGHSMGGFGAWWVGLGAPDRFAGIFPWSGFHPAGELAAGWHLGPGMVHSADDGVVGVEWTEAAAAELASRESPHDLHVCEGYGHESRMIGDWLEAAVDSLLTRETVEAPLEIRLAGRHGLRMAGWWLASLGTGFGLTGEVMELEAQVLRPWEHGLGAADPARPLGVVRIFGVPGQAVALHTGLLVRAAGGPLVVELATGSPGGTIRADGPEGEPLLILPPGATMPPPLKQGEGFSVVGAGDEWVLVESDGSWLGRAPDRSAVAQLASERMMELGSRPSRLKRLELARGAERIRLLERWIAEAARWGLEGAPECLVVPEGALVLPESGPLRPVDLLESYVRAEELLGVFQFGSRDNFEGWLEAPRPFALRAFMAPVLSDDGEEPEEGQGGEQGGGPVVVAIPLALAWAYEDQAKSTGGWPGGRPQLLTAAGYDGLVPEAEPDLVWRGPAPGWPAGFEGHIVTPGMLALSAVYGVE